MTARLVSEPHVGDESFVIQHDGIHLNWFRFSKTRAPGPGERAGISLAGLPAACEVGWMDRVPAALLGTFSAVGPLGIHWRVLW